MKFLLNTLVSAAIISLSTMLAEKKPGWAGLIVAIPIATLTTLALTQLQLGESNQTFLLAKSIFLANILTLSFFIPFLVAKRFELGFWPTYGLGTAVVLAVYSSHSYLFQILFDQGS